MERWNDSYHPHNDGRIERKYQTKPYEAHDAPIVFKGMIGAIWESWDGSGTYECKFCGEDYVAHSCKNWDYQTEQYECCLCRSHEVHHGCTGCNFCGSYEPEHDCIKEAQRKAQTMRLEQQPIQQVNLEQRQKKTVAEQIVQGTPIDAIIDCLDDDCGNSDWEECDSMYCQMHVFDKLEDWHETFQRKKPEECTVTHFMDCKIKNCNLHRGEINQFHRITNRLARRGYDFKTHTNKDQRNTALIKSYHRMIKGWNEHLKCKWCLKYQGKLWQESHLDKITIDSIEAPQNRKLLITGQLHNRPVKIYVDSGADRNLIADGLVTELQLPRLTKKNPLLVSSIIDPDTEIEIDSETDHLPVLIAGRTENLQLNIMAFDDCDIILGNQWLHQSNPLINWKTKQIKWEDEVPSKL
jgi:Retroviral aspartyl protease